jgi:hypothetical protein
MADLSPLRRRMIKDMTVRNLSPANPYYQFFCGEEFFRHPHGPSSSPEAEAVSFGNGKLRMLSVSNGVSVRRQSS